ncbi:DUF418 domain-containing protein [Nocardiopsis sp. N85]|uniref:DUF418 domain-containing protein n=1 Tax=Nocardiopsis sp. N85 TaxID=3029400 RepID=UPI00237F6B38|nr:DUF418 domain-containing protein [Nocardiopsis sp. N85]MDE3720564.1 DUF418 domain-containing protein [Nocardiopsis sp. N85]
MTDHAHDAVDEHRDRRRRARSDTVVRSTPLSDRSLAPDLARGMMLLLIALAHVPYFLHTAPTGAIGVHPVVGNTADKIAQALTLIVVDARVYTMFGFLFAYGIGQMYARQTGRGTDPLAVRRLLRRRHLWMIAFGAVHAALLWQGDIIGVYGLIGLIMVPLFFGRTDRTLKVWIGILLGLAAVSALLNIVGSVLVPALTEVSLADQQRLSIAEPDYLVSVAERLSAWLYTLVGGFVGMALPAVFLMGVLAARHRLLDEPGRHLVLLRRLALWGVAVGWTTGAALALQHTGVVDIAPDLALVNLHLLAGILTGVGYAGIFGLIAHRLSGRAAASAGPVHWIAALGRRSMSGYLAQSLAWGPLLAAWGLGLGAHLSSWSVMLFGVAVWAATVAVAVAMERRGLRGPAEVALRGLTYRAIRPAAGGRGTN